MTIQRAHGIEDVSHRVGRQRHAVGQGEQRRIDVELAGCALVEAHVLTRVKKSASAVRRE